MKSLINATKAFFENDQNLFHRDNIKQIKNYCSYNFNRDIDKLCLINAFDRFLKSGTKDDAFDIFFCFSEIFNVFGEGYNKNTKELLEVLCDFEINAGSLVLKHRDHYSHSAYVFALGLAIYENNINLRSAYCAHYSLTEDSLGREDFLYRWGMVSLFHDVGYPYELIFEEGFLSDKELDNNQREHAAPILRYGKLREFNLIEKNSIVTDDKNKEHFADELICRQIYENYIMPAFLKNKEKMPSFDDFFRQFRDRISKDCLYRDHTKELSANCAKQNDQISKDCLYMDHGYFSAVILLKKLVKNIADMKDLDNYIDIATAICLHNSYYKWISNKDRKCGDRKCAGYGLGKMTVEKSPLAYLLMLCDELQCWNRIPYGKNSKKNNQAWNVSFETSDSNLDIIYKFDDDAFGAALKIKDMKEKIEKYLDLKSLFKKVSITAEFSNSLKIRPQTMSIDYFRMLVDVAFAINSEYCNVAENQALINSWNELTLEYKMSNILSAKSLSAKLDLIGCFYSDADLGYEIKENFTEDELEKIAIYENCRYNQEKKDMGWRDYTYWKCKSDDPIEQKKYRETNRIHKLVGIKYSDLSQTNAEKDRRISLEMMNYIKKHTTIKYYSFKKFVPREIYKIGIVGHRNINEDDKQIVSTIKKTFETLSSGRKDILILSSLADGADMLCLKIANELKIPYKVLLPDENFKEEITNKTDYDDLIKNAVKIFTIPPITDDKYFNVSKYIVDNCNVLVALWDGNKTPTEDADGKPINVGGTYDSIKYAKKCDRDIQIIKVKRAKI